MRKIYKYTNSAFIAPLGKTNWKDFCQLSLILLPQQLFSSPYVFLGWINDLDFLGVYCKGHPVPTALIISSSIGRALIRNHILGTKIRSEYVPEN